VKPPAINVIDYETEAIQSRPAYPPRPVGVAIQLAGSRRRRYYAWGHPTKNNCTEQQARAALAEAYGNGHPLLTMHGKFDLDVAEVHHKLKMPSWEKCHDVEYLLFLHDPHAKSLGLKPSAERILGMPPEERDELQEWILSNVSEARRKPSEWAAYICRAPGDLVGRYACGDLERTEGLFRKLYPEICDRGMLAAYDRERKLMPILLETERVGIRTDLDAMERDYPVFLAARERVADWLRKALHAPGLNLDADRQVGDILDREDVVTEWTWTKGGHGRAPQRSVSKKLMTLDKFHDQKIAMAYGYYQRMGTVTGGMFMETWLELAQANGGWLKPNWNQVRQDRNGGSVGTRSGRPSCDNPNFLNVSKSFENNKGDGYTHPKFIRNLPELPLLRRYILPDEDGVILHRDINQQELRILAHFADGQLAERYREKPYRNPDGKMRFDIHSTMQQGIFELCGLKLNRDSMKFVDFGSVYGTGVTGMAEGLHVDRKTAAMILAAKAQLMPDVDHPVTGLNAKIKQRFREGLPIRTFGGREYYCEPPSYSEKYKRVMTYEYKGLNYLVQPSSADYTKETIIRYDGHPKREGRFAITVYDENNVSTPSLKRLSTKAKKDIINREMSILRECMEEVPGVDVPMLTDGKTGPNWGDLEAYRD
jgi:DNA polymerase I-like protein with 3'-5' exonuclease and polymerase domains